MAHTILVADDSVTIRRVIELTFQDTDIRVEAVGSGHEAEALLAASRPDLVLADVVMPPPSGYELCRRVKGSRRPVPVLLLRGAFDPFDDREAEACGADGQLLKPFEPQVLVERVTSLLARAATHDAEVPAGVQAEPAAPEARSSQVLVTPAAPQAAAESLRADEVDAIVRAVVERLSADVVREIAWEVVPDLAAALIRERIREIERDEPRDD